MFPKINLHESTSFGGRSVSNDYHKKSSAVLQDKMAGEVNVKAESTMVHFLVLMTFLTSQGNPPVTQKGKCEENH